MRKKVLVALVVEIQVEQEKLPPEPSLDPCWILAKILVSVDVSVVGRLLGIE